MQLYIDNKLVTIEPTRFKRMGFTTCYVLRNGHRVSSITIPTLFLNNQKSMPCYTNGQTFSHKKQDKQA